MAKKKKFKDRIAEAEAAAAKSPPAKNVGKEHAKEPESKAMPTAPVKKAKRPRYVRPPRTPAPAKVTTSTEPRMVTFASRTLTIAAAKLLAMPEEKAPPEERFGR
jgi:hypothetical protein